MKVTPIRLSAKRAVEIVKEVLKDSGRVVFLDHAEKRMRQRRITRKQVFNCLDRGVIVEGPALDIRGKWKFDMETFSAGDNIHIAVAIDTDSHGNKLVIITAYGVN